MVDPTINDSKPLQFTGTTTVTNSRVVIYNRTTGEYKFTDNAGNSLKCNSGKKILFDCAWFASGWSVGDVIECKISGKNYGSTTITLTAASLEPQTASITTATMALSAGGL